MKKITFFFLLLIASSFISIKADEIAIDQTQDLKTTILNAPDGSVIVLTDDGGVYPCASVLGTEMVATTITIKAAPGLSVKPTIQFVASSDNSSLFFLKDGENITLQDVKLDGGNTAYFIFIAQYTNLGSITLTNCDFTNVTNQTGTAGSVIAAKKATSSNWTIPVGSVNISNCRFINVSSYIILCTSASFNDIKVSNCLITGTAVTESFSNTTTKPNTYEFDHITLDGRNYREFNTTSNTSIKFSNIIFANSTYTARTLLPGAIASQDKIAFFNYATGRNSFIATIDGVDPLFGVNHIATASQYAGNGTDNKTIGYYGDGTPDVLSALHDISKNSLNIYPSIIDKSGRVLIEGCDGAIYKVVSLTGSVIDHGIVNNNVVSLNKLQSGVYCLVVGGASQRFIVK